MKLLLDQNVSFRVLKRLPIGFSGSTSLRTIGLHGAKDVQIWEYAKRNEFVILTHDSDFNDFSLQFGFPLKVIWLRTGNRSSGAIVDLLTEKEEIVAP